MKICKIQQYRIICTKGFLKKMLGGYKCMKENGFSSTLMYYNRLCVYS